MAQLTGGLWEAGLRSGTALGARDRARRHLGQFGTYGEHEETAHNCARISQVSLDLDAAGHSLLLNLEVTTPGTVCVIDKLRAPLY